MRPAPSFGGDVIPVGAVREPPVWKGKQSKPWIPAFAGMTAKGQPRRPFDPVGNNIETAARISPPPRAAPESRHSGEGRSPEPGRAARERAFPANPCAGFSPAVQGQVATRPCGTFARRRAGWEYGAKDNHRGLSLRFAPRHRRARKRGA